MARSGFPSMTALLGMLAVAGYQNRDTLSRMMGGRDSAVGSMGDIGRSDMSSVGTSGGGLGGLLGGLLGGGESGGRPIWVAWAGCRAAWRVVPVELVSVDSSVEV
ncbi:hypothetical protein [Cypionkella sp.]|uniref:hypothetical protein n=1 Tax=Cypionkella sp. TaxID=2811411 RepID=UPI00262E79E8|nr:hypothetical protein [Cypionkella sp.]